MSTLNQKVAAFLKSHKNQSAAAMALLGVVMEHALSSRDWTPMARLTQGVEPRMQRRMQQIIGRCMGGVTGSTDTKAEFGYRFKLGDNAAFTDQKAEFDILIAQKVGIYSGDVEKFLGLDVKAPAVFDPAARATALAEKAVEAGTDLDLLLELVKRAYIKANAAKVPVSAKVEGEPAH
jgi:hypothetical protein